MKKYLFFLSIYSSCLLSYTFSHAQTLTVAWAKGLSGGQLCVSAQVMTDALGNVYTIGWFHGTVDFDPGAGSYSLTSVDQNAFISKLDSSGNFVWAKSVGGYSYDDARSIAIDASGDIYVTGNFASTVDFDPGAGVYNLTAKGANDFYILKLNSYGELLWAKAPESPFGTQGGSIAIDAIGNVYLTGGFQGDTDFDPGPGVYNVLNPGTFKSFVLKLDSSGDFVWVKAIGGIAMTASSALYVSAAGNIYICGFFYATADFDPGSETYTLTSSGGGDGFILHLDASGNFVWAKSFGGISQETPGDIDIDAAGNIYLLGWFDGITDFDPGTETYNLSSSGGSDVFLLKLNASGAFTWARSMGGASYDQYGSMALDPLGNIYITGTFAGVGDFDPGPDIYPLVSLTSTDFFISKLDASGNFLGANSIGSSGDDQAFSVASDAAGNLYITGSFSLSNSPPFGYTVDFDPGVGTYNVTAGDHDVFILKLNSSLSLNLSANITYDYKVQLTWQTFQDPNPDKFVIEQQDNRGNFLPVGEVTSLGNSSSVIQYAFTDSVPVVGANFYRLKIIDKDGSYSYSQTVQLNVPEKPTTVSTYPNPASEVLQVKVFGQDETAVLQVVDGMGKIVKEQTVQMNAGAALRVDISTLKAGKYYLSVRGKKTKSVGTFMKL